MTLSRIVASGLLGAALVFCLERFGLLSGTRRAEAPLEAASADAETPAAPGPSAAEVEPRAVLSSADTKTRDVPSSDDTEPRAEPSSTQAEAQHAPLAAAEGDDAPNAPNARDAGARDAAESAAEDKGQELLAMSESYRSTTILTAIRDAGLMCTNMTRIRDAGPGIPAWWVGCEDGLAYWVGVDADGRLAIDLSPYNDQIAPRVIQREGDVGTPLAPGPGPDRLLPVQPLPVPLPDR